MSYGGIIYVDSDQIETWTKRVGFLADDDKAFAEKFSVLARPTGDNHLVPRLDMGPYSCTGENSIVKTIANLKP